MLIIHADDAEAAHLEQAARLAGAKPTSMLPRAPRHLVVGDEPGIEGGDQPQGEVELALPEGPPGESPSTAERQVAQGFFRRQRSASVVRSPSTAGSRTGEPGAEHQRRVGAGGGGMAVGSGDLAAMRLDDLARDREAET